MTENKDRKEILDQLRKEYPLIEGVNIADKVEYIPSGSLSLDMAIGVGGFPKGTLVDIFGRESSGKSLISLLVAAECQKLGGIVVMIDAERNYTKSKSWMKIHGIDADKVFFLWPETGEQAFDFIYEAAKKNAVDMIIVDSATALRPLANLNRDVEQGQKIGAFAQMMSLGLNKITPEIDNSKIVCIFINQLRDSIQTSGPMIHRSDADKATGGNALRFYSSLRIGVKKMHGSEIKNDKDELMGHTIICKIFKNKVAPPHREATFEINFFTGVNRVKEAFDIGIKLGIIKREGNTYSIDGNKIGVGISSAYSAFAENKDLVDFVSLKTRETYNQ